MEVKKYCIILKNGAEISVVTDRLRIKRSLVSRKITGMEINDPEGFVRYLAVSEIAAVLAYTVTEEAKGNG